MVGLRKMGVGSMSAESEILWQTINDMRKVFHGYKWIADCEWGDYSYEHQTVETLQKEVGFLLTELERISNNGQKKAHAAWNKGGE